MSTLSAGEVLRTWFEEVWNRRNGDLIADYLAPDGVIHNVDESGADLHGPEAFRSFHRRILDTFSDIHFTLHEVIESGPMAAARWSARLTHDGEGLGVPATGQPLSLTGMAMIRVEDGRVVESWDEWDRMRLAMACGMVAPTR
jgi:steroid delta-isomerase-like uncharacterized protein